MANEYEDKSGFSIPVPPTDPLVTKLAQGSKAANPNSPIIPGAVPDWAKPKPSASAPAAAAPAKSAAPAKKEPAAKEPEVGGGRGKINPTAADIEAATSKKPQVNPQEQEAKSYLKILGKTYDGFKAENVLNAKHDLAGKAMTSPDALNALKERVANSPEAKDFAKKMLERDATQDRKPGLKNADLTGEDVKTLQRALVASGIDIGKTGPNKDGIDGVMGPETRKGAGALLGQASPDIKQSFSQASAPAEAAPPIAAPQMAPAALSPLVSQPVSTTDRTVLGIDLTAGQAQQTGPGNAAPIAAALGDGSNQAQASGISVQTPPGSVNRAYVESPTQITVGQGQGQLSQYVNQEAARFGGTSYNYAKPMSPAEYRADIRLQHQIDMDNRRMGMQERGQEARAMQQNVRLGVNILNQVLRHR